MIRFWKKRKPKTQGIVNMCPNNYLNVKMGIQQDTKVTRYDHESEKWVSKWTSKGE